MRPSLRALVAVLLTCSCFVSSCVPTSGPVTDTPGVATPTESPTSAAATPTRVATLTPHPTATLAATSPPPTPSASPTPRAVRELEPPLVMDSERGRIYLSGVVDGHRQIVALDASDGQLLQTYPITGSFAVDGLHGWLYVDRGSEGLSVVNLQTGEIHRAVELPPTDLWTVPGPWADPATGTVLAFRNNEVLFVDPQGGVVIDKLILGVQADPGSCGTQPSALPIQQAVYDAQRRILHLEFLTYVCTPWSGYTIVSHEMDTRKEIGRTGGSGPTARAIAHDGYLYGSSWYRMGFGFRWATYEGQTLAQSSQWQGGLVDLILDSSRSRLYEAAGSYLRVLDSQTMALQMVIRSPVAGQLVGYDWKTDQLYFLADGQLQRYPASEIVAPGPQALVASEPPATPLRSLIVSPGWPQDQTLFGIWEVPVPDTSCWVFGQPHGLLLISTDGGETWKRPPGLEHACGYVTTLAVSKAYAQDHTLLAGLPGLGLWRSSDGGRSWQPLSGNLPGMGIAQILLSPAWVQDQTAFVRQVSTSDLYRTNDGGVHWEPLRVNNLRLVDMSMEFAEDRTLMAMAWEPSSSTQATANELLTSTDGGQHWNHAGELGASRTASLLSMAPLFAKWQVVFVHGDDGWLYRSENGGAHWVPVLQTVPPEGDPFSTSPRLLYAPGTEANRSLFLLATDTEYGSAGPVVQGKLYRSNDGGQSWQEVPLPGDVQPTAVSISPTFQEDGLLFLGTADGRMVTWPVG
jgi:photosystem II stability/assembly factor-like uncharacterized protein